LCGHARECLRKEIEGREFDICADCWRPLEEQLKGKGRVRREREMVVLPPDHAGNRGAKDGSGIAAEDLW